MRLQRDIADMATDRDAVGTAEDGGLIARLLATPPPVRPAYDDLAHTVLVSMRPAVARRAAADFRRRVFVRVLLAVLPLPFVLTYAGYVLQALYLPISRLLSPDIAGYVAGVHVLSLALLFGATYAAIPMMLGRSNRIGPTARTVRVG